MENDDSLKLIYVLKIGRNTKGDGLYEFIFSKDASNIDYKEWCWDVSPACDNANPPTEDYIDLIVSLKTSTFNLFCLHEAIDREYMHGYHTIHALAYEIDGDDSINNYESMFDSEDNTEFPLLVFHYGMSLKKIKELFEPRKIVLYENEFVDTSTIKIQ